MRIILPFLAVMIAIVSLHSCKNETKKQASKAQLTIDSTEVNVESSVMYFAAPAPDEILTFFDNDFLFKNAAAVNSTDNLSKYNKVFEQGMNLGVYMADAAYLNFNSSPGMILPYMDAVFTLSDKLQISSMIDQNSMVAAMENRDNMDSVIHYSGKVNKEITDYLIDNNQQDLLCLMSAGSLIEILYLISSDLAYSQEYVEVIQQLADQKILFDNVYEVCLTQKEDPNVAQALGLLEELKTIIDGFDVESKNTELEHDKGQLLILGGDKVSISKEQYTAFKSEVLKIRTTIVK